MKQTLKRIGLAILIVAAVIFYGRFFLDLFGIIKYELPLSQSVDSIVQVDLLDTSSEEFSIQRSLTGEDMNLFLSDLMALKADRYANDPVVEHGDKTIRICYLDGGYDLLGDMVEFFDKSGEPLHEDGWFCIPADDLHSLFVKYAY